MLEILDTFGVALLIGQYPHGPLGGLAMTLILSASALLLAFPLAVLVGIGRTAPLRPVRTPISEMWPPTRTASIDCGSVPGPPTSTT